MDSVFLSCQKMEFYTSLWNVTIWSLESQMVICNGCGLDRAYIEHSGAFCSAFIASVHRQILRIKHWGEFGARESYPCKEQINHFSVWVWNTMKIIKFIEVYGNMSYN